MKHLLFVIEQLIGLAALIALSPILLILGIAIWIRRNSCDAATAKARELGARIYMEPMTLEKVGRFSVIADPASAVSSLFEPYRS